MNELIKYFEALEARLAAQDERIAKLESVVSKFLELQPQLEVNMKACTELTERMHKILDEGIQVVPEPEVDVELVYPEDEHSTKGTTSHFNVLCLLVSTRFQVLFHSPPGVLFTFPSRYCFSIGSSCRGPQTACGWSRGAYGYG